LACLAEAQHAAERENSKTREAASQHPR
jgi:hypothetical protein